MSEKVLYVSYGTNMNTERFMAYITGGTISGSEKVYGGCRDKTSPSHKVVLSSNAHQGYFSRNSSVWGEAPYNTDGSKVYGGLGVIGERADRQFKGVRIVDPKEVTLAQLAQKESMILAGYVITTQQFSDVMKQENAKALVDVEVPEVLIDILSDGNRLLDLRNRTGENAIQLPDGSTLEIEMQGAYCALLYLGEVEIDGEMVKAVTFTTPFEYKRAAAQSYVNMALANAPVGYLDKGFQAANEAIEATIGMHETDKLHRLNPATRNYIDMVISGIVELGEGCGDWTRENALEYVLTQPPFHEDQIPEFAQMVRDSFEGSSRML